MDLIHSLHILFRLINFAAFGALIIYLFNKKILTAARKDKLAHELEEKNLMGKIDRMQQEGVRADQQIIKQKDDIQALYDHLEVWRMSVAQEYEQKQQEKKIFMMSNLQHKEQQQELYQKQKYIKNLIPVVFKEATKKLEDIYHDQNKAQEFNQSVLLFLQRRSE